MVLKQNSSEKESTAFPSFWVCYGITSLSAVISMGYALSAAFAPDSDTNALYAASRSVALALAVLSVPLWRSRTLLVVLAFTMAAVQALDALIGSTISDPFKTAGPAFLAVAGVIAARAVLRRGSSA